MQSITSALSNISSNISNAVMGAMNPTPAPQEYTRADIIVLEEAERTRRMHQATSLPSQQNALLQADLIKKVRFPFFHGTAPGFKKITNRLEENERKRRMMTKPELAMRKANANLSAGMIRALGWPFISSERSGPQYVYASEPTILAERERLDRINNPLQAQLAKNNAALVANALRWGWTGQPLGSKRHTRLLEEKERTRRMMDREGIARHAEGSYQLAGLIRNLPINSVDVNKLEEEEKARRLSDKNEQVLARQHGAIVSRLLPMWASGKSVQRAEQERKRRVSDVDEQQRAMEIAHQLSSIVHGANLGRDVEHERQRRVKHAEHDRAVARQLADIVGLKFSKRSASHLYEKEARHRMRDVSGERLRRANANKVAGLLSAQPGFGATPKNELAKVEEVERKQRMYDWPTQQMHMRNARKASDMIKAAKLGRKMSPHHQLEKERNRRMVDTVGQAAAVSTAKKVSDMVRNNTVPLRKTSASFFPETSLPRSIPADFVPPAQTLHEALPFKSELLEKTPVTHPATLPFKNELLEKSAPATRPATLPFKNELLEKAPVAHPATLPFKNELLEKAPVAHPAHLPFKNELLEKAPVAPATLPFKNELLEHNLSHPRPSMPEQSLPFKDELLRHAPLSHREAPAHPHQQLPFKNELLEKAPVAHPATLPFKNELLEKAPVAPATLPFKNELLNRQPALAPVSNVPAAKSLPAHPHSEIPLYNPPAVPLSKPTFERAREVVPPVSAAPLAQPATPLGPAPSFAAPLSAPAPSFVAPLPAPVSTAALPQYAQPAYTGAPLGSSAPVFAAPLYGGAPITMPDYSAMASPAVVSGPTFYSAAGEHVLSEQQRRRLEKQALRHNRKAAKDNARAEKLLQKAEKLHARGKDSRASRKENKAEQKVISSKQHAIWANDLLAKQNGSAIPAQQPVWRPAF